MSQSKASVPSRSSEPLEPEIVYGFAQPRLLTEPLRPLTPQTSRGFEVIDFARDVLGQPLMPWQEQAAIRGLELLPNGNYRFRTVVVLVARQQGKTFLSIVIALWKMYVDSPGELVLGVAQDLSIAREVWAGAVGLAQSNPFLASEIEYVRQVNGEQTLALTKQPGKTHGSRYRISAANRSAGRGLSVNHLTMDEIRQQRDFLAWSALSKTTTAKINGQIWAISNAGDMQSVVLNQLRDAALAGTDDSIGILEWSAPDNCALDDVVGWQHANPGLGHTVSIQAIKSALTTDPPQVFRTEVLCQKVDSLSSAIDAGAWNSLADTTGNMNDLRDRVSLFLDVAPDGNHATLVAAAEMSDHRIRVEVLAAWSDTDKLMTELPGWLERVKPERFGWMPGGPAAGLAPRLRGIDSDSVEIKGQAVSEACQGLSDLVNSRRIVHPGDPLLDAHVIGSQRYEQGDGWRFVRKGVGHVDAAYACAGAVYLVLSAPEPEKSPTWTVY